MSEQFTFDIPMHPNEDNHLVAYSLYYFDIKCDLMAYTSPLYERRQFSLYKNQLNLDLKICSDKGGLVYLHSYISQAQGRKGSFLKVIKLSEKVSKSNSSNSCYVHCDSQCSCSSSICLLSCQKSIISGFKPDQLKLIPHPSKSYSDMYTLNDVNV